MLSSGFVRLFENSVLVSACFLLLALFLSRDLVLILGNSWSPLVGNSLTHQGRKKPLARGEESPALQGGTWWSCRGRCGLPALTKPALPLLLTLKFAGKWDVGTFNVINVQ